jgi:hypothetical protein
VTNVVTNAVTNLPTRTPEPVAIGSTASITPRAAGRTGSSGFRVRVQRIIESCDRVGRKDGDLVETWAHPRGATHLRREINRSVCCLSEVIGANPEEEPDDGSRGVADTLIDAVISAHPGHGLAVIGWEKSIERDRGRANSMYGMVVSE